MSAREQILTRLRRRMAAPLPLPEVYRTADRPAGVVDLFVRRAREAAAEVVVAPPDQWAQGLAADLRRRSVRAAAVWDDPLLAPAAAALREAGVAVLAAAEHAPHRLEACEAGVTTAQAAVALSGTLVLGCGPGRPRATSLLPPLHVAVVPAQRVVATLEDLMPALSAPVPSALTLVTGPSRTADIELVPVRGAHGPVDVLIYVIAGEGGG